MKLTKNNLERIATIARAASPEVVIALVDEVIHARTARARARRKTP